MNLLYVAVLVLGLEVTPWAEPSQSTSQARAGNTAAVVVGSAGQCAAPAQRPPERDAGDGEVMPTLVKALLDATMPDISRIWEAARELVKYVKELVVSKVPR